MIMFNMFNDFDLEIQSDELAVILNWQELLNEPSQEA